MTPVSSVENHFPPVSQSAASTIGNSCLESIYERVIKNPFFWGLALTIGTGCSIAFAAVILPPMSALGVSAGALSVLAFTCFFQSEQTKKWVFSEFSLMWTSISAYLLPAITHRSWYNSITDQLTLGANPLNSRNHLELLRQQGHNAILSMVEPFETDPHLFGVPVKPEDWTQAGFTFLNLPNPDLTAVRNEDVERGVAYLHQQISLGRRIYVHCQAGVGRSATIIICYLIKHQRMSPADAVAFVNNKRSIAVDENSPAIRDFFQRLPRS